MNRLTLFFLLLPSYCFAGKSSNLLQYNNQNGDIFSKITNLFQAYVDFLEGPFATMAIFGSLVIGLCAWIYAPKNGALGFLTRICIGGIVILNTGTVINMLQKV